MRRACLALFLFTLLATTRAQDDAKQDEDHSEAETPKLRVDLDTGGHTGTICKVFFSHDGKQIISVSKDATIRYWSVQSGELLRTLRFTFHLRHGNFAHTAALSADRRTLVVSPRLSPLPSGKRNLLFVDLVEGKIVKVLSVGPVRGGFCSMVLSPDGSKLATGHWYSACVWDTKTGEKLFEMQRPKGEEPANGVAFGPSGRRVAVMMSPSIHLMDLETKKVESHTIGGHLKGLFWSPDKTNYRIAIAHRDGLSLFTTKNGRTVTIPGTGATVSAHWEKDGELLILGGHDASGGRVSLVKLGIGKANLARSYSLEGTDAGEVNDTAFSPDGKLVAAAFGPDHGIRVWHRVSGEIVHTMKGKGGPFMAAGWSADGNTIAWARARKEEGKTPLEQGFDLANLRWSPLKSFVGFHRAVKRDGDRVLNLGDPSNPARVYTKKEPGNAFKILIGHAINGTFLSGNRVALGPPQGIIHVYDATQAGEAKVKLKGHQAEVNALIPSPNEKYLLTASSDQTLKIWNIQPGQEKLLLTLFVADKDWIIWTPEGYYAATPGGEKLMGWRLKNSPMEMDSFFATERFRKRLERPDVIKLVLAKGNVADAVKEANRLAKREDEKTIEAEPDLPPSAQLELVGKTDQKFTVKVTVKARSKSQPVTALRLQVNGRSFPEGKFAENVGGKDEVTLTFKDVELPPGQHDLRVLVRGKDVSDVSNTLPVKADMAEAAKPKLFCLPIGLNYDWDPKLVAANLKLEAAQNDAETLLKALRENCTGTGNRFQTVIGEPLLGKAATSKAILEGILNLRKKGAQPGDTVVIFYAGHGITEGRKFYLLTADVDPKDVAKTGLSGADLREALKELPCQVLLVFDACQSGAALPNFAPATDELGRALSDDEAAVTVLAAARGDEAAGEQKGNGRLTLAITHALAAGPGMGYDPYEYTVNIHNVYSFVHSEVRQVSKGKQNPVLLAPWSAPPLILRKVAERTNP